MKKSEFIAYTICPCLDGAMGALAVQTILKYVIQPKKSILRFTIYGVSTILSTVAELKLVDRFQTMAPYNKVEEALDEFFEKHKKTK